MIYRSIQDFLSGMPLRLLYRQHPERGLDGIGWRELRGHEVIGKIETCIYRIAVVCSQESDLRFRIPRNTRFSL